MEILPITIAEPRADRFDTQADDATDGWFDKLLRASDERPDFREPASEEAPGPDRAAAHDRPADDRSSAAPPAGDQEAGPIDNLSAHPERPAGKAPATALIESSPEQRVVAAGRPAAKVPPGPVAPGTRTGSSGRAAQLGTAGPAEKPTHAGPPLTAMPATAKADAAAGKIVAPSPASGNNPGTAPEPVPSLAVAPLPQLRIKPQSETRPKGPGAEPPAKPSGAGERPARKEPAVAKSAAARHKASAEAPRHAQNLRQSLGTPPGLTAASPGPGAKVAPAPQPGTTTATLGPGQSAANGNPAPAEARPAPPAPPPGGATEQVALRIHKAVAGGQERISIKLHPAELGRIEVKLAWSDDGLMRAMIVADKGETLELLQRDSRALERALQDAGIKTDSGSLSFEPRGQGGRGDAADDPEPQTADSHAAEDEEAERNDGALPPAANLTAHRGLLDLRV